MGVCSSHTIGACRVNLRVDCKCRSIDWHIAINDLALMVNQNQIRYANMAEVHAKGIYPEMVRALRVSCRDMSSDTFIKAESRKETKGGCKPLFTVRPLLCGISKRGDFGHFESFRSNNRCRICHGYFLLKFQDKCR